MPRYEGEGGEPDQRRQFISVKKVLMKDPLGLEVTP